MSNDKLSPELMQALWEAGKAAAKHLGLGEPEYMTICGRGEERAMQEERTINWRAMTPEQRDELIVEKVLGYSLELVRDSKAKIPRFSQSLDAAWLILQEMVKRYQQNKSNQQFEAFADLMLASSEWDSSSAYSEIYPACEIFAIAAKWTPEMIDIAALRALGYEVLTEEASQ